jgi:hypothetical protein
LCTTDTCSNNQCIYTPSVSCNASDACVAYACNPATGQCDATFTNCTDPSVCTVDTCDPVSGCVHSASTCQDGKQCTSKNCDPSLCCQFTPDNSLCPANTTGVKYVCATNGTCITTIRSCDDNDVRMFDSSLLFFLTFCSLARTTRLAAQEDASTRPCFARCFLLACHKCAPT